MNTWLKYTMSTLSILELLFQYFYNGSRKTDNPRDGKANRNHYNMFRGHSSDAPLSNSNQCKIPDRHGDHCIITTIRNAKQRE